MIKRMAKETQETTQLPLSVKVSPWSGVTHNLKKSAREFRYTSPIQVLTNFLFWLNLGVVASTYIFLQSKDLVILNGIGVTLVPAGKSNIPLFIEAAVNNLTLLPYLWFVMCAVFAAFTVVCIVAHSSGRYSMTTYLLGISLLLVLLLAKVIVTPILLIGG